jgi:predicted enzyme related to lactoylglutathione lyase
VPTYVTHAYWADHADQDSRDHLMRVLRIVEAVGGQMLGWCMSKSGDGWLVILEAPSLEAAQAAIASSSGGAVHIKGTAVIPSAEARALIESVIGVAVTFGSPIVH